MQTQSDIPIAPCTPGQWAPRTDTPKRSIFGNYRPEAPEPADPLLSVKSPQAPAAARHAVGENDAAVGRSFLYRWLANAFADPEPDGLAWLRDEQTAAAFRSAATLSAPDANGDRLVETLATLTFEGFRTAYAAAFGHAARGSCPLNEIEYGDLQTDPLFQPHRLADIAAFYRAFGLQVCDEAGERQDHISLELEFMCVLTAKEAFALQSRNEEAVEICRTAQKKFLREHLGRWTPAFTRRLAGAASDPFLGALAAFTRSFIETECRAFRIQAGSEDLLLRPVDEAADRMCDSCGLTNLPPGAGSA